MNKLASEATTKSLTLAEMGSRLRYFKNPYPDYDGSQDVNIDLKNWTSKCKEIILDILVHRAEIENNVDGGIYVGPGTSITLLFIGQSNTENLFIAGVAYSLIDFCQNIQATDESFDTNNLLSVSGELLRSSLGYLNHPRVKNDIENQSKDLIN